VLAGPGGCGVNVFEEVKLTSGHHSSITEAQGLLSAMKTTTSQAGGRPSSKTSSMAAPQRGLREWTKPLALSAPSMPTASQAHQVQ
jgi:hypothetical protein